MKIIIFLSFFFLSFNLNSQVRQWVSTTSSPSGFTDDRAFKIAVDGLGNVYVTGQCHSSSNNFGIGTAKYNSSGIQQWFVTYTDLSSSGNDSATGIATDIENNVYVIGKHYNSQNNSDYILIKYNSSGVMQWGGARFSSGSGNGDDVPTGIAIENDEIQGTAKNVYITGYSFVDHALPEGANYDMITIKYNAQNGNTIWTNDFDAPDEINEGGTLGHGDDKAFAIAIVPESNQYSNAAVYISGYSFHIFSIRNQSFVKNNNIIVQIDISDRGGNVAAYSYYNEGVYSAIALTDAGLALAVSPKFGKIYELGFKHKDATNIDLFLLQNKKGLWNESGSHQVEDWCATYVDNLPGNNCFINTFTDWGNEAGYSLALIDGLTKANQILIYVCGTTQSQSNGSDFLTIRYHGSTGRPDCDPDHYPYDFINGNPVIAYYDGSAHGDDVANSITIGTNNNIYVAGTSSEIVGAGVNKRFAVAAYNSDLVQIWTDNYPRSTDPNNSNNNTEGFGVTANNTGVYATGYSFSTSTGNDYTSIAYSTSSSNPEKLKVSNQNSISVENKLFQNFPNPFNPKTDITFSVNNRGYVRLTIFDVLGRRVSTLIDKEMEAGLHTIEWDGSKYASGLYYYRITAGNFTETKKLLLIK